MSLALISHPDCQLHEMGPHHPESPERIKVIDNALKHSDIHQYLNDFEAPLATREQLLRVHDTDYVDLIFDVSPKQGYVSLDADVLMNPDSLHAALRAAGGGVLAVDLLMKKEADAAFCNIRPPGHHAERDKAMGFCLFNNVAVAVAHALDTYQLKRAVIIDFDVHHGNGTEDIFKEDSRVLYCSSFEHPFYPFSGAESPSQQVLNVPLPAGTSGEDFRNKTASGWFKPVKAFNPDIIFFSAGFDAYYADQLADLKLKAEDYRWITQEIKKIALECCEGRMISVLEGGYDLQGLGSCVVAHLQGMID